MISIADIEEEDQTLKHIGALMQDVILRLHRATHPVMLRYGIQQKVIDEMSRRTDERTSSTSFIVSVQLTKTPQYRIGGYEYTVLRSIPVLLCQKEGWRRSTGFAFISNFSGHEEADASCVPGPPIYHRDVSYSAGSLESLGEKERIERCEACASHQKAMNV